MNATDRAREKRTEQVDEQKKEGALAWDREPQRSRSLIRPRRDRIMGSSILASLSEAGGNDPFLPVSGPLPPHELVGADRVGTRPTQGHMQVGGPNFNGALASRLPIFNDLTLMPENRLPSSEPIRNQSGTAVPNRRGRRFEPANTLCCCY